MCLTTIMSCVKCYKALFAVERCALPDKHTGVPRRFDQMVPCSMDTVRRFYGPALCTAPPVDLSGTGALWHCMMNT